MIDRNIYKIAAAVRINVLTALIQFARFAQGAFPA